MNRIAAFVIGFLLVAGVTSAQTVVNQGRPGNQGPWPVTFVGGATIYLDAGLTVVEAPCVNPVESFLCFDGGAASPVPATALAGRRTVLICNTPKNTGSPIWTIRVDGVAPTTTLASPGQDLAIGDCISYPKTATSADAGAPIYGISDTNSACIKITECQ